MFQLIIILDILTLFLILYMGEVSICEVLTDPKHRIAELKAKTQPYSPALKDAIIDYFIFEASFSLMFAKDNIDKDDVSYLAGHCFRVISCLNQVLFAMNEAYCVNEKKAVRMIEGFTIKPQDYKKKVEQLISLISTNTNHTKEGINLLEALVSDTEDLISNHKELMNFIIPI